MSVAMDIIRALDPSGLKHFTIYLDTPGVIDEHKPGEVWTIKVVPFEQAETVRKEFNKLFDNNKPSKSWVVENKAEVSEVLQEIYQQFLTEPFNEDKLNISDLPAVGRYTILIHVREILPLK
jgi:hypothetical protein